MYAVVTAPDRTSGKVYDSRGDTNGDDREIKDATPLGHISTVRMMEMGTQGY